jgi:type VI secretion system protein VasJ
MANLDEARVIDLGKSPIAGDAPCGQEIGDDEEYMFVLAEMGKLDRIDLGEVDWFRVEQAGENILRAKSKDVEIAAAHALTLFKRHRYAGLSAAFEMLRELVAGFWDGLFPQRPRRRKVRIEAACEKLVDANWLSETKPNPDEFDAVDAALTRLDALRAALTEKLPDEPPDFNKLTRKLKEIAGTRPKAAAAPAAPAEGGAAPAAGGGGAAFAGEAVQDVSGAVNAILAAATFIRKTDPADPLPYAVARFVKWAKVELPKGDAARNLDPPDKTLVETLSFQFEKGVWDHLLKNAEGAFRANDPLWLDVQRYACTALENLGAPFTQARAAVLELTANLVKRLGPGVYELAFRGGLPLCSGETKMWLEAQTAAAAGPGRGGGHSISNGKLAEAGDQARKLAGSGKLNEAVKVLQDGLAQCSQRRDRFLWRLRIAQLCYDSKRLQLAAPLLDECFEDVRQHRIAEWEPELAVDAAQTLYRCRKALVGDEKAATPATLQALRESYAWLCQLDPLAALAAEPAAK